MKKIVASIEDDLYAQLLQRGKFGPDFDIFVAKALKHVLHLEEMEAQAG